jgi:hypothetical protein
MARQPTVRLADRHNHAATLHAEACFQAADRVADRWRAMIAVR